MNATMTRTRKTNKVAERATGTVKLIAAPVLGGRLGELVINGKGYLCQRTETGFRLCGKCDRDGNPVSYDLPLTLDSCDCPDATYRSRPNVCKHAAALAALVARGVVK